MAFFIGIGIWDYYVHRDSIVYSATTDLSNRVSDRDMSGQIVNLTSTWDIASNWTSSDVFSAQTWLTVDIIAKPTDNLVHNRVVTMFFPGAITEKLEYQDGHLISAQTPLTETLTGSRTYTGEIRIKYQSEGDKCFILVEPAEKMPTRFPGCPANFEPVIHISSADSKFQYETNKVNTFILWLGVGFSVASVYWYIREIMSNQSVHRGRNS